MAHTKYYTSNGVNVPSVTTVISNNLGWNKQILINWAKKIALQQGIDSDEITKEAASIGTITHYLCECKIKNEMPDISEFSKEHLKKAKFGYMAFCNWEKDWKPTKYLHSEVKLVSEEYLFGGTIDLIAEKDNKIYLLDIKTSNYVSPEMAIQLSAYRILYEETYKQKIESGGIIKLSKDSEEYKFYPLSLEDMEHGWDIFNALLRINNNKKLLDKSGK